MKMVKMALTAALIGGVSLGALSLPVAAGPSPQGDCKIYHCGTSGG